MERLQKIIAAAGVTSRRGAEELIAAGRVTVNGAVQKTLGTKVDPAKDVIEVDGKPLPRSVAKRYVVLNKPTGYVTTRHDDSARPTVMNLLPEELQHLHPVGRLDMDTMGMLFLTNDGEFTHRLTHPRFGVRKTYVAVIRGELTEATMERLKQGVTLRDGHVHAVTVESLSHGSTTTRARVTMVEGRKRIVRRMLAFVGHPVQMLQRIEIGPVTLSGLDLGEWRELSDEEVAALMGEAVIEMEPNDA